MLQEENVMSSLWAEINDLKYICYLGIASIAALASIIDISIYYN